MKQLPNAKDRVAVTLQNLGAVLNSCAMFDKALSYHQQAALAYGEQSDFLILYFTSVDGH